MSELYSAYSQRIAVLQAEINDLKHKNAMLRDQEHELSEMARREQMVRTREIPRIAKSGLVLVYEGEQFIVKQEVRRGKLRGTWQPIHQGEDFEAAYAAFKAAT